MSERFVIATSILPDGTETDSLFIEPADAIDDGCVALTSPLPEDEIKALFAEMKAQRDRENPNWYHASTLYRVRREDKDG